MTENIKSEVVWLVEQGKLKEIVAQTLRRNHHPEANIRILVTGGSS